MPVSLACYHESGHAIAYVVAGRQQAQVIEIAAAGETGHCRVRHLRRDPVAMLAGYAAELRARHGRGWRPTARDVHEHMRTTDFSDAARALGTRDPAALLDAWDEAAALIDREWYRVTLLAETLQSTGYLGAADIEMIAGPR